MMPSGWSDTLLKDLVAEDRKITYGIVQPGVFDPNGIPLIRGKDYSFGWVPLEEFFRVSPEVDRPYRRSKVRHGDLLLTIVGAGTGNTAIVPSYLNDANITQTTARISVDAKKAVPMFVYHYLNSETNTRLNLRKHIKGQAQPGLNLADVEIFKVLLPPLNEQEKIAKILSTWDKAIEKLENVLTKYEIRFEAVAKKLFKATNFAELSEVCEIKTGKKDVNEGNPNGAYPFFTCAKEITYSDNYSFDTTAVLVSGNGVGVGYCHYYQGKFEAYQRTYVLSKFKSGVNPQFIYFYLNFYLRKEILRQKQDTAMPYIKIGLLNSFKVPNIDEVTQNKICTVLNDFNRSTQIYSALLSNIKLQKQGLMQQLLTGKKRVKV